MTKNPRRDRDPIPLGDQSTSTAIATQTEERVERDRYKQNRQLMQRMTGVTQP